MNTFNEITEKVKDIISNDVTGGKVFDKDVAAELGISQATFATMKKRGAIPYKELMEFCARRKISINWLFFDQAAGMLVEETEKFFQVKYFSNVRASAGGGSEGFGEEFENISIDNTLMKAIFKDINFEELKNKEIDAIKVDGESMEPTLKNGSIVFVDRTNQEITKDGIFIVSTPGGLFIKRLNRKVDGSIELISDNRLYSPEVLAPSEVQVVGKVIGDIERL
jgi:SOS-response transcriptional repressor LexA